MTPNEPRLKNVGTGFLDRGGFGVVSRFMLKLPGFEGKGKAKHSPSCLTAINKALGSEIWLVIGEILEQEMDVYCRSPGAEKTAGTMTPKSVEEFSLITMRKHFESLCPQLSRIVRKICPDCKSDAEGGVPPENVQETEKEVAVTVAMSATGEGAAGGVDMSPVSRTKRRRETKVEVPASKKRRVRDKSFIGTVCLAILAFGHSRNANLLQMIMGYYFQGYSVEPPRNDSGLQDGM